MNYRYLLLILAFCSFAHAQTYLSPLDFGLSLMEHGRVDYCNTPPNIQVGNYNSDCYPDIARFSGNKLEIFLFMGKGYTLEPQQSRIFTQPIKSLTFDDNIWDGIDNLVVTFEDKSEKTFCHSRGVLDLNGTPGAPVKPEIPRIVSEADFEIVWESEPRPYGMNRCTVGDLDNDGITELVTWWKESQYADTAWILIYKCAGDDEYELFMEEPFDNNLGYTPGLSYLLITDLDQNGKNELIYTYNKLYIWEFESPGVYTIWDSNYDIPKAVEDAKITDVNNNGIPEVAVICPGSTPPTAYIIKEFWFKVISYDSSFYFYEITNFSNNWSPCNLALGDFDNDGATDMVPGYAGYVTSYEPLDILYYRYDVTVPDNFSENWLQTGIPLSCVTPIIEDLDGDGENELFSGGLFPNGGSTFVWEGMDFEVGYVSYLDTTSSPNGPNESCFGIVDYIPSISSIHIIPIYPQASMLLLWSFTGSSYENLWQSTVDDCCAYRNPYICDTDQDGKKSIVVSSYGSRALKDWEQISAGVWDKPHNPSVLNFRLYRNYPNPFNPVTNITYDLPANVHVSLAVYNVSGKKVRLEIITQYRNCC